jgi:hypothetical protein
MWVTRDTRDTIKLLFYNLILFQNFSNRIQNLSSGNFWNPDDMSHRLLFQLRYPHEKSGTIVWTKKIPLINQQTLQPQNVVPGGLQTIASRTGRTATIAQAGSLVPPHQTAKPETVTVPLATATTGKRKFSSVFELYGNQPPSSLARHGSDSDSRASTNVAGVLANGSQSGMPNLTLPASKIPPGLRNVPLGPDSQQQSKPGSFQGFQNPNPCPKRGIQTPPGMNPNSMQGSAHKWCGELRMQHDRQHDFSMQGARPVFGMNVMGNMPPPLNLNSMNPYIMPSNGLTNFKF